MLGAGEKTKRAVGSLALTFLNESTRLIASRGSSMPRRRRLPQSSVNKKAPS